MSDLTQELTNAMSAAHKALREHKTAHPEEKLGFWNSPGSILNAYREGDLSFNEAVEQLKAWKEEGSRHFVKQQEVDTNATAA